jgi:hypothetical protein
MVKELQLQVRNLNERIELLKKEITFVRKESVEENNKIITSFNHKLKNEVVTLQEQLEDARGDIAESIKQRKRERADLVLSFY